MLLGSMISTSSRIRINMKVLFFLSSLSLCHCALVLQPLKNPDDYGASLQFNNQDEIGNYNFGYNEGHLSGGSFRRESGDVFGNKVGSYGLRDADGRVRIVTYVADANGFRADVRTNEPGVEPQDPASTTINKPVLVPSGKPIAPIVAAPPQPPPRVAVAPLIASPPQYQQVSYQPLVKAAPAPVAAPYVGPAVFPYATAAAAPAPIAYQNYRAYPGAYYASPYSNKVVGTLGAPNMLQNYFAIAPPGYAYPYATAASSASLKSLPAYQPLGYS